MFIDEGFVHHILNIPREKKRIGDAVISGICISIFNSLLNVFNADDFFCRISNIAGNGAGSCVKIINNFRTFETCKALSCPVKHCSLTGICLKEWFWTDPELQAVNYFREVIHPPVQHGDLVGKRVILLLVDDVHQRCYAWKLRCQVIEQAFSPRPVVIKEDDNHHELPVKGITDNQIPEKTSLFPRIEEDHPVLTGVVPYSIPYHIWGFRLKETLSYIKYLIK